MEFATYVQVISRVFRTEARLKEFKEFFEPKLNVQLLNREIKMDTKVIETRVELIKDEQDAVNKAVKAAL